MTEEFDPETEGLVEQYLLYLRGRGPEPSVPGARRDEILRLLELVDALDQTEPPLPELEDDPVAVRLGIVPDRPGSSPPTLSPAVGEPVGWALKELGIRFGGYVDFDLAPPASLEHPPFRSVGVCTSLGDTVAVYVGDLDDWAVEPDLVAVIFRRHVLITAVAVTSEDAERAVVRTAAESNPAIDPERGWLPPATPSLAEPLTIALGRHLEAGLAHWDRITRLDELLGEDDLAAQVAQAVTAEVRKTLKARPQLAFRQEALRTLQGLDPDAIAAVVADVQSGQLSASELIRRAAAIAGSSSP